MVYLNMTKQARTVEQVKKVKENILDKALEILIDEGYDNLSMSKIGKRTKMTAPNLYNYYSSKDELYCAISISGYNRLLDLAKSNLVNVIDPYERVITLFESLFEFGKKNPHYYYMMFTMVAPKYLDYVGSPMESIALEEKENAVKVLEFALSIVHDFIGNHSGYTGMDGKLICMQFWSQLHGIISLLNNGNLVEADEDADLVAKAMMNNIATTIKKGFL